MYQTSYKTLLRQISVIGYVIVFLSGCLVSGDDGQGTIVRTEGDVGITLHTYQDGDFIKYKFSGQQTIGLSTIAFNGTILVKWNQVNPLPQDPFTNSGVRTVLKEVTTVEDDNGDILTETFRYIAQDKNGSYILNAFNDTGTSPTKYYWLDTNNSKVDVEEVELFHSPFDAPGHTTINYNIMRGCDGVQVCDKMVASVSDDVTYRDTVIFNTPLGGFDTLHFNYNYSIQLQEFNKLPSVFDFRAFCSDETPIATGDIYMFPEVGVVGFFNSCSSTKSVFGHLYTAQIIATNISYPRAIK